MWLGRARRWGEFKVIIWARQAAKGGLFFIGGVNSSKQHGVSILFDGFIVPMTPDKDVVNHILKNQSLCGRSHFHTHSVAACTDSST